MTSWKRFFALFLLGLLLASGAQACVEHCECFHCDQHAAANCETVRGDLRIEDNGSEGVLMLFPFLTHVRTWDWMNDKWLID